MNRVRWKLEWERKNVSLKIFIFIGLLALFCDPDLAGVFQRNVGMMMLVRGNESQSSGQAIEWWTRSLLYLDRARLLLAEDDHSSCKATGYILLRQGDSEGAIAVWHEGRITAEEIVAWNQLSDPEKPTIQPEQRYRIATLVDPESSTGWMALGRLYEDLKEYEMALEAYHQAILRNTYRSGSYFGQSSPYYSAGRIHWYNVRPRDVVAAESYIDQAIAVDDFSDDTEACFAFFTRGEMQLARGEYGEATRLANGILERMPSCWRGLRLLALSDYRLNNDFDLAKERLLRVISHSPQYAWPYYDLGQLYEEIGELDQAKKMYEAALDILPHNDTFEQALKRIIGAD